MNLSGEKKNGKAPAWGVGNVQGDSLVYFYDACKNSPIPWPKTAPVLWKFSLKKKGCLFAKKNTRCLGPESSIHEIASRKNKFLNGLPLKDSSFHSLVTTPNGNGITLLKNSQHLCFFFPDLKGTKSVDETRPRPYPQRNPGLEKSFSLQDTHWISRILPSNLANNPDPWFWR